MIATACKSCQVEIGDSAFVSCETCEAPMHEDCVISFGGASLCDICFTIAEETPNKFGDFELPEFVRRTHIETYRACPYKFYQEVIKGHEMPPNEYTQVGSDVHEIIEKALVDRAYTIDDALHDNLTRFNAYGEELFTSKSKDEMFQRATESLDTFYNVVLPDIQNVFAIEETIFTNIGDNIPDVRITMDLITEEEGELHMHDWKTGRVMVGKRLSSDLQAPLYIYSVREHYKKPVKSFTFYYLQENKIRTFVRSETNPDEYSCFVGKREYKINVMDAVREVKSIFSKIKKGQFDPVPNSPDKFFTQKMCHLKELGLCCQDADPWNQI